MLDNPRVFFIDVKVSLGLNPLVQRQSESA